LSWLSNIRRNYKFRCTNEGCGAVLNKGGAAVGPECIDELNGSLYFCEICEKETKLEYAGFDTLDKIGLAHSVQKEAYDRNGRIGYKIGNTHMSKTKYDYLESGKIQNQYTPAYRAHLEKDAQKNEYLLKTEENKKRAHVAKMVKSLPDGEYVVK